MVPIVWDHDGKTIWLLSGWEGPPEGLWSVDVATATLRKVADLRFFLELRDGVAWLGGVDPRDPNPPVEPEGGSSNSAIRFDLATGTRTTWFYLPGQEVWIAGLDSAGHPIVFVSGDVAHNSPYWQIRLVDSASTNKLIYAGTEDLYFQLADSHGLWFTGGAGLYLYTAASGMRRVTELTVIPAGTCA
jgi:hypothetical protein